MIEKEGLSDSVFPPDIQTDDEEGVTSAVAVQSEKEAVEEEPKTCQLEYTKDEQDDLGNYMDDQSDAVDRFDGEAGVINLLLQIKTQLEVTKKRSHLK